MATRLVLASSFFLYSARVRQLLRSSDIPLRFLSDCAGAEQRGHLPLREVLTGQKLIGFGILAAEEALVLLTEHDVRTYSDSCGTTSGFPIQQMGAIVLIVPEQDKNNPEAIATMLAPHGNFALA